MHVEVFTTVPNAYMCQHVTVVWEYCDVKCVCHLQN